MAEGGLPSRVVPKPPSNLYWEEWEAELRGLSRELGVQVPEGMFQQLRQNANNTSIVIASPRNGEGYTSTLAGIQEDQHEDSDSSQEDDHSGSTSEDGGGGDSFDNPHDADAYDDAFDNYDDTYNDYDDYKDDDNDYTQKKNFQV